MNKQLCLIQKVHHANDTGALSLFCEQSASLTNNTVNTVFNTLYTQRASTTCTVDAIPPLLQHPKMIALL